MMVSALLSDALKMHGAQAAIAELFKEHASGDLDTFPAKVEKYFSDIFRDEDALSQIPSMNVDMPPESFKPGSIVRFRAMVQDTSPAPEIYLAKTRAHNCGGWGVEQLEPDAENFDGTEDFDYANLRDRAILFAVNVPSEPEWYRERVDGTKPASTSLLPPLQSDRCPVPAQPHICAQVKIYQATAILKPTEIATFVGILTNEPIHSHDISEPKGEMPTLHVLFVLPSNELSIKPSPADLSDLDQGFNAVRGDLIQWIATEALGGDTDVAESILLTTIATVQSRTPAVLPPSLTVSRFPSPSPRNLDVAPTLVHVLSLLVPAFVALPLTLPYLNTHAFAPSSSGEYLRSGVLQLPAKTVVLVTESGVAEGKVEDCGVRNIRAMQDILTTQTLHYAFPFSSFPFPTELRFIVLAQGNKSTFLQTTTTVPLCPTAPHTDFDLYKPASSIVLPSPSKLDAFRELLFRASNTTLNITDAVSEHIQTEFVKERQTDLTVTADNLIARMTTARLMALSAGLNELNIEIWHRSIEFQKRLKARSTTPS